MIIPVVYSFIHTLFLLIQNMTLGTIHKYRVKIGNNVSEFTHLNWMTKSYYSSPKNKESASIDSQYNSLTIVALDNII